MSILVLEDVEPTRVIVEEAGWVLVLDEPQAATVVDAPSGGGFLLVDSTPEEIVEAHIPADFLLVDGPQLPPEVRSAETNADIIIITSGGTAGRDGQDGQDGQDGADGSGTSFELTQSFASPQTTWVVNHNFGTYGVEVDCFDTNGDLVEGSVRYVSDNSIEVDWYYPLAGVARVWR